MERQMSKQEEMNGLMQPTIPSQVLPQDVTPTMQVGDETLLSNEPAELAITVTERAAKQPTKAQVIAAILDQPNMGFVDWKALMGEGVVVKLHIRRVRFRKRLQFADLGIHFSDKETELKMQEIFRLGMKNLLTKEYLDRIEQIEYRARKLLVLYSFDTIWGFFIPVTAYLTFRAQMELLEQDYYQVREDILANYPTITKQVLVDYVRAARHAYRILHQVDPEALTERERGREAFYLAGVRHKVRKILPTPDDIRQSFGFEVSPTYIDLPRLAGDESNEDVQVIPGPLLEKRTIDDITEEEQRELRWRQETTRERQAMMQAMNEDVVRKAREQKQERIDQFLTKIITQVRGLLYDATTNVLASMKKSERLQPRAVVQLRTLVENLRLLNFYGDQDVERAMNLIERLIEVPHEDRDLELIEQRLRQIATVMRSTLLPLEFEFREERLADTDEPAERVSVMETLEKREQAGVPRRPSRAEVREARMELEFSMPSWDDEEREERMEDDIVVRPLGEEREERIWS
jgi:hypothetical protein